MGRQNEEDYRKRLEALLIFISRHQPVPGDAVYDKLYHGSRQSFMDDVKAINRNGEIIVNFDGGYRISESAKKGHDGLPKITYKLSKEIVRQWLMLAFLSGGNHEAAGRTADGYYGHGLTFDELLEKMNQAECEEKGTSPAMDAGPSVRSARHASTYRKDLASLEEAGLVRKTTGTPPTYTTSAVVSTDTAEMQTYQKATAGDDLRIPDENENKSLSRNARVTISGQQAILDQISILLGAADDAEEAGVEKHLFRTGRNTDFTDAQLAAAEKLRKMGYEERALSLHYRPANPEKPEETFLFYAGSLVYSVETTRLYLLGFKDVPDETAGESCILDVEHIDFAESRKTPQSNPSSVRKHFRKMLPEMFDVSVEPAMDVRVRFENQPFVKKKLERLIRARTRPAEKLQRAGQMPKLLENEDLSELIYLDRIRGLENFARYLRGFGRAAIAEEPPELAERMKATYERLTDLYIRR